MSYLDKTVDLINELEVDHTLDNPNQKAQRRKRRHKSGEKYIQFCNRKFVVRIWHNYKQLYVCTASSLAVAIQARDEAIVQLESGEFKLQQIRQKAARSDQKVKAIIQEILGVVPTRRMGVYLKGSGCFVAQTYINKQRTHLAFSSIQEVALVAFEKGQNITNKAEAASIRKWALDLTRRLKLVIADII